MLELGDLKKTLNNLLDATEEKTTRHGGIDITSDHSDGVKQAIAVIQEISHCWMTFIGLSRSLVIAEFEEHKQVPINIM